MSKRRYSRIAAADHLGVSVSTIRRMIERGELETERDGPPSNGKVWVLLDAHVGNPDGTPPDLTASSAGTPGSPPGNPAPISNNLPTSLDGVPSGVPVSPGGMPYGLLTGTHGSPDAVTDSAIEVAVLRQQVQHMKERVKDLEQLSQDRADRLKESEWRYHELVKQVTSTMEHVTKALPAAAEQPTGQRKRGWWPFKRGQRQ